MGISRNISDRLLNAHYQIGPLPDETYGGWSWKQLKEELEEILEELEGGNTMKFEVYGEPTVGEYIGSSPVDLAVMELIALLEVFSEAGYTFKVLNIEGTHKIMFSKTLKSDEKVLVQEPDISEFWVERI